MPRVQPPSTFPGDFFVLVKPEHGDLFQVVVDDAVCSSYILGPTLLDVRLVLVTLWGLSELFVCRAVDLLLEFKAPVQVIPSQERAVSLWDRNKRVPLVFPQEAEFAGLLHV